MTYIVYTGDKVLDIFPGCWATDEVCYKDPNIWLYWGRITNSMPIVAYCINADLSHVCDDNIDFKPEWYDKLKLKVV